MYEKMVFLDIDGTILTATNEIPGSTKEAIKELQANGVYVAIATGRAPFMFDHIRETLNIQSFVSFNGQYVVFEGKEVYKNPIKEDDLIRLNQAIAERKYPIVFSSHQQMKASVPGHPFIEESLKSMDFGYPEVDPNFYQSGSIYQALLFCKQEEEMQLANEHHTLDFIRWHEYSCDIIPMGGSKAIGVQKLMEASGLAVEDTYAFGDGLNDMEMLKEIGTGVAMGNAISDLKQVADYITDDVDKDGIAKALKHFALI
ncbi:MULTISPECIES: Cof-type HAD-IIB family hydrolase [Clostridia]|uniref:Cof-type HAD-IIB family hydrolase n=1 Tax=Clostridia TaxID=186801 RepID=UPI000EA06CEA|nr:MULTISPECIES: Cof-type HAD-IIB family hydrolase [Clostridia]NBJ70745.1 Cof-type HAD-IIB family hydrolase [Roseburia sp. 1XD42-34]RKI75855.1 Cof-type HAD-IIB family hydrolase [Clostridium sp. 1xD42-85]